MKPAPMGQAARWREVLSARFRFLLGGPSRRKPGLQGLNKNGGRTHHASTLWLHPAVFLMQSAADEVGRQVGGHPDRYRA